MSKRSAHGTHVWVRTDLVEAILHNDGTLPKGWKPASVDSSTSRKRGRTTTVDWGWARAYLSMNSSPGSAPSKSNHNNSSSNNNNGEELSSPFGKVKLRKTHNSPMKRQMIMDSATTTPANATPKVVSVTVTIDDEEFASPDVQHCPVSFTYDTTDHSLVCMANSWWYTPDEEPPEDLTNLSHLHEPAVVYCLQKRYEMDAIYTYTGKILLALNPFRQIDNVYGEEVMRQYWSKKEGGQTTTPERPPPHIYAVAEDTYRSMMRSLNDHAANPHHGKAENQSILVSGESGAGKTVTTKIIMKYLATLSQNSNRHDVEGNGSSSNIEAQVLQSNPILESFGNARTIRNDNSSRFGKYIKIDFHASGNLVSASIETYLLEKVRLITQEPGNRNYHVFYEILAGVSQRERQELRIGNVTAHDFRMTAVSGTFDRRDDVNDRDKYKELRVALDTVGFSRDEQYELLVVACALLHTSNISFLEHNPDASELDLSNVSLEHTVKLLGVSVDALNEACCRVAIEARGETLYKNNSISQARKSVEALIKATYSALFTHIVRRINSFITITKLHSRSQQSHLSASIGVLDIFGFESFLVNSFEQLCINYCNEALQQQFNSFVFKLEQEEYKREGLDWSFISFPDNKEVIDLIDKKRDGILSILDEQCRLQRCTDSSFARAVYDKCASHPRFVASNTQKVELSFSIHHYAGWVEYNAANFLEKNKDELPKETTDLLISSEFLFIASLGEILSDSPSLKPGQISAPTSKSLPRSLSARNNNSSLLRESVGSQFSSQLSDLRNRIAETSPHYVRCLKPNDDLIPYNFQPLIIADQLRCAGVLEAIRVSRVGFPHRFDHSTMVGRYGILAKSELDKNRSRGASLDEKERCEILVHCLIPMIQGVIEEQTGSGTNKSNYSIEAELIERDRGKNRLRYLGLQMGRTKVFLRPRAFEALEALRTKKVEGSVILIQSVARMFLSAIRYELSKIAVLMMQCQVRKFCATRRVRRLRLFRRASTIQNAWRLYTAQLYFSAAYSVAIWGQRYHRGSVARELCMYILLDKKSTIIQHAWKRQGWCHPTFYMLRSAVVSIQCLFRKRKACATLKHLRNEARDLSHVAAERDQLKMETRRLREELEKARQEDDNTSRRSKEDEVKMLKDEIESLRRELERPLQFSPTASHADAIGFLKRECEQKEEELRGLGGGDWRMVNSSPFSSNGPNFRPALNLFSPSKSSVSSTMSLLDTDVHDDSYEVPHSKAHDDLASGTLSTTISLATSMNTSNLKGEAFYTELRKLHDAVRSGDPDVVAALLDSTDEDPTITINEGDEIGRTALHIAVLTSNLLMARVLLQQGAVANAQDNDGETALHLAVTGSMTELLLREGHANPNIPNIDGICALHLAVQRRDVDSVGHLLQYNANVNCADNVRWFVPLHLIALPAQDPDEIGCEGEARARIAELLSGETNGRYKPDLNERDSEGNTPMHYAVQLTTPDALDLVEVFLQNGSDVSVLNNRQQSVLHLLCHNDALRNLDVYPHLLQLLLKAGADPNQQSSAGCTALHLALYHRDIETAAELVMSGAELHLLWKKPKRWVAFWNDMGTSSVLALDMVESPEKLLRILSAITKPPKWAPSRSWCMHCRGVIGTYQRALHCLHCGRFVCGACSPCRLSPDYFASNFEIDEPVWVCVSCEKILVARKKNARTNRMVHVSKPSSLDEHHQDVSESSTQPVSSFHDEREEC